MLSDIRRIDIETYAAASKLSGQSVLNSFAMKFSIPVSLAVYMVYGDLSIENVTDEHVENPEVKRLAANIFVRENKTFTEQLPDTRRNKMTIMGENGKIYEEDSSVTKGDYLDPFGREELIAKFNQITEKVWSCERQKEIVDYVVSLEQKKNFKKLFDLTGRENSVRR